MSDAVDHGMPRPRSLRASVAADAEQILRRCRRQVRVRAVRASGPGGQNVNKVSTAVQVSFDVANCTALEPPIKRRLLRLGGKRSTASGILLIHSDAHRSQLENRKQAMRELQDLLARSLSAPRVRVPTPPTKSAREERLRLKKLRGQVKQIRSSRELD
jgi:ribosome-associated protein